MKSKTKLLKRALCAFLAAAMLMSFAGCEKKGKSNSEGSNITVNLSEPRQIVNYFTSKDLPLPEDMGYINEIACSNDKIYISAEPNYNESQKYTSIFDTETKTINEIDLSGIEYNYLESVLLKDGKLYMVYSDLEYNSKICIYDIASASVLASADAYSGASYFSSGLNFNANGNIIALKTSYGAIGNSKFSIIEYSSSDLSIVSENDISEVLSLGNEEYISGFYPDSDGSFYFTSSDYSDYNDIISKLHKFSSDFELIYSTDELSDMEGYISSAYFNDEGNICICSTDNYVKFFIDEINASDGSLVNMYEVKLSGNGDSYIMSDIKFDGYDFVYRSSKGFIGYNVADQTEENIIQIGTDVGTEYENCYTVSSDGKSVFMYAEVYGDSNRNNIYVMNLNGEIIDNITIPVSENGWIYRTIVTPEGKIYYVEQASTEVEEDDDFIYYDTFIFHILDSEGKEITKFEVEDLKNSRDINIQNIDVDKNGNIYISAMNYGEDEQSGSVFVVDNTGKTICSVKDNKDIQYISSVVPTSNGVYVSYYSRESKSNSMVTVKIDMENNEFVPAEDFEIGENSRIMPCNDDSYAFYYSTSDGIFGFNVDEKKSTEIINWVDSDIDTDVNSVVILGADTIVCNSYDYETGTPVLKLLSRADEETLKKIQNKKIITVAGVDLSYTSVFSSILDFNKTSEEYRIQVSDYGKYSKYEDDTYVSGAFKLNSDITSGNVPDIIIGNYELDMTTYETKGLLTDINALIEKDSEISKSDYLENIFDIYSTDGKLYQLVTDFSVLTLAGKQSELGAEPGWRFDEFFKFAEGKNMFYNVRRSELIDLVENNLTEFVDFKNKTCDFNNDNFIKLIELIKEESVKDEDYKYYYEDEDEELKYRRRFKDGNCHLESLTLGNFYNILELQQCTIGEEVSFKGIPSSSGNGALVSAGTTIGISEKSSNKDAAWSFVRQFLLKDYQDSLNENYISTFPVMKSAFEDVMKNAQNSDYTGGYMNIDSEGNYVEITPLDDKTAEKIKNLVEGASIAATSDTRINGIIDEQLNIFFEGGQTAKEAAEAIQSKASLYLKEIK